MDKIKRIRIDIHKSGEGNESHEYEYCPIFFAFENSSGECPLGVGICKYGLTAISPPARCPIGSKSFELKLSIVEVKGV